MVRTRMPRPRLVVDNSPYRPHRKSPHLLRTGGVLGKVPLELLEGGRGEAATLTDPREELAVVDHDGGQASLGDSTLLAEARRITQQLVFEGHCPPVIYWSPLFAGISPHVSIGFSPQASHAAMRDNSLAVTYVYDREALVRRIKRRLKDLDLSASAACEAVGMRRDYLNGLLNPVGDTKSPTLEKAIQLAAALKCHPCWLLLGEGPPPEPNADPRLWHMQSEACEIMSRLDPDNKVHALMVLQGLEAAQSAGKKPADITNPPEPR